MCGRTHIHQEKTAGFLIPMGIKKEIPKNRVTKGSKKFLFYTCTPSFLRCEQRYTAGIEPRFLPIIVTVLILCLRSCVAKCRHAYSHANTHTHHAQYYAASAGVSTAV